MTCTKQQPGILYCDIYFPWKHRPPLLFGTYRYPVFIYVFILTVTTFNWMITFVDNLGHVYKNFFLFLSVPSFSLLNWFWTKTIWCHNECSFILSSHNNLFLTLIGRMCKLKIASIILQNLFLACNGDFFQAICSQSTYNRDIFERTSINELK